MLIARNCCLHRCEILRVLLLLLIEPNSTSSFPPDLTAVLDKYAWESEDVAAAEEAAKYLTEEVKGATGLAHYNK